MLKDVLVYSSDRALFSGAILAQSFKTDKNISSLNSFAVNFIENRTPVLLQHFAGVPAC